MSIKPRKKHKGYIYTQTMTGIYNLQIFADKKEAQDALKTEQFKDYQMISGAEAVRLFGTLCTEGGSVLTHLHKGVQINNITEVEEVDDNGTGEEDILER